MEAFGNCTIVIGTTEEAVKQANSIIDAMYKGCVSCLVVVQYLVMPHVRHLCVLVPLVRPQKRHKYLGLHIVVSLKGRTTCIWSFGCGFACATIMGCAGFRLLLGIIIVL